MAELQCPLARIPSVRQMWVTNRVTQSDQNIYLFKIHNLEREFESSPGR